MGMYCGNHRYHQRSTKETATTIVRTADDQRVSDREREAVIDVLRRHTGEGRLTMEEFEERTTEVLTARTGAELRATIRDLPALRAQPAPAGRRLRLPDDAMWLVPALVISAVVAVLGGPAWPLWVFGPWLAFVSLSSFTWGLTRR